MKIQKTKGVITQVVDLGDSAREVAIQLATPLDIIPGAFMNLFVPINDEVHRRAYSIASDFRETSEIKIAVRKKEGGAVSPFFWSESVVGAEIEVMGPLGLNTIDKMQSGKVFLVGYGIGVSVIKALVYGLQAREDITEVYIITGNRDENDILYKDFFDFIIKNDTRFSVRYVVAHSSDVVYPYIGYAQDFIDDYDFSDSDVYVCGQEVACNALVEKVKSMTKEGDVQFFVEAFH